MNKILSSACLATALVLFGTSAHAQKTIRITVQMPTSSHITKNLQEFADEVQKKSNGDLKVEIYPSAQLFKDKDVPRAVGTGQIEMGAAVLTRYAGVIPAVDIFYVPFTFPTAKSVSKATARGSVVRKLIDKAIRKTGSRVLWWQPFGRAVILSNNFDARRPSSLKGKKVRVFSQTLGEAVQAVGGEPVVISGSEQFLAYQRGMVDAGMSGITSVESRKLYQVMNTITLTNHAVIEFVVVINEKFYDSLSSKEKNIIQVASKNAEKSVRAKYALIEKTVTEELKKKAKEVSLSPDDIAAWKNAMKPVIKIYKKRSGALGLKLINAANHL